MRVVDGHTHITDVDSFLDAVSEISERTDATVQVFDARYIVDRKHLVRAVTLAQRERSRGEAIVRDEAVEILLYAAGRRQIERALEMGVSTGNCPVVGVAVGGDEQRAIEQLDALFNPGETLGAFDENRVCEFFDITDRERHATAGSLNEIVHERVTLLVVER